MPFASISSSSITSSSRLGALATSAALPRGPSDSGCSRARSRGPARGSSPRHHAAAVRRRRHPLHLRGIVLDDRELPDCGLVVVVRLGLVAKELVGPEQRPSATACAQASGSSPPMPAPWTTVATVFTAGFRQARATSAERLRTAWTSKSSALPSPATSTRGAGIFPKVWIVVRSPAFPRMSPSSMSLLIAPSSARSTRPWLRRGSSRPRTS